MDTVSHVGAGASHTGYPLPFLGPLIITNPGEDLRIEFIRTVIELKTQDKLEDGTAVERAKAIFAEAGITMPGVMATRKAVEATYPKTGAPARGAWVLLRKEWLEDEHGRHGDWVSVPTWDKAKGCYGRVTTRDPFQGRPGEDGLCFNVRCLFEPGRRRLVYSTTRLYLVDEGVTWKPVDAPH